MSEVEGTDGRVLADRYRLGDVLGKGGMGTVWRAVDETLGRDVAVKELRFPGNVDEDEKRRLVTRTLREAKATARIRNSGAITVFDVVKEDDRPWIVMELVEGRSLSDAIREDGPLTPKRAAEVALVVLDVLKAAHKEGILHRDVKPSNVLIADDGRVVLGDFGIAQIDGDPSVTSTGMLVGAPSYISPERARGQKPGPPADLWSLGALLYASVEGRPPYDKGSAIATLTAVMTEPVGPMANAGPLAEVIKGLLAKDPEQRLDDAGARTLLTAVASAPDHPVAPPAPPADAPTAVLPVGLLPASGGRTPTPPVHPPAATREAAADQTRVRDALRSVRKAASKPAARPASESAARPASESAAKPASKPAARAASKSAPAPEPGTPADPPRPGPASLTDVVPRRTLVVVVVAVVLALLGTVIGIAIVNSGGGDKGGSAGKGRSGGHKATASPSVKHTGTEAAGSTSGSGADGGEGGASATPSTPSTPSTGSTGSSATGSSGATGSTASAGSSGSGTGSPADTPSGGPGSTTTVPAPAGYFAYHDAEGFWIALPNGWKRIGDNGHGVGSTFSGGDGRQLLVDWTHTPHKSALKDWQNAAAAAPGSMTGYQQIALGAADYRGYNAADWEYKRQLAGRQVHVLNRGMVTDADHGYAIMFTTPAGDWDSAANRTALQTFFATFKPAK